MTAIKVTGDFSRYSVNNHLGEAVIPIEVLPTGLENLSSKEITERYTSYLNYYSSGKWAEHYQELLKIAKQKSAEFEQHKIANLPQLKSAWDEGRKALKASWSTHQTPFNSYTNVTVAIGPTNYNWWLYAKNRAGIKDSTGVWTTEMFNPKTVELFRQSFLSPLPAGKSEAELNRVFALFAERLIWAKDVNIKKLIYENAKKQQERYLSAYRAANNTAIAFVQKNLDIRKSFSDQIEAAKKRELEIILEAQRKIAEAKRLTQEKIETEKREEAQRLARIIEEKRIADEKQIAFKLEQQRLSAITAQDKEKKVKIKKYVTIGATVAAALFFLTQGE